MLGEKWNELASDWHKILHVSSPLLNSSVMNSIYETWVPVIVIDIPLPFRWVHRSMREPRQPQLRQEKWAYLTIKNYSFLDRRFFIFIHFTVALLLSMTTCFAVLWTTWALEDKTNFQFFLHLHTTHTNLISGLLICIWEAKTENWCRPNFAK